MSEPYDDERPPVEGVRILGAAEARASLGETRGDRADDIDEPVDLAEDEPQLDLRDPAPTVPAEAIVSTVPADAESVTASARTTQTWSAEHDDLLPGREPVRARPVSVPSRPIAAQPVSADAVDGAPVGGGDAPTDRDEAPTGEIPPLPHWTEPPTGAVPAIFADDSESPEEIDAWATVTGAEPRFRAGSDWAESDFAEDLSAENVKLGALSNEGPVDEDEEFERDLAARRPGPAGATTRPRRPPRTRTPGPSRIDSDRATRETPPARDLPTAIMTGLAVAVVAIVSFTHNATTVALACVVVGVATLELASSLRKRGLRPATLVALVASTLMPVAARHYGPAAYPVFFGMVVIVSMLWFLWEITPGRPLPGVASTVLVFAYVGGLGGFAGLILASSRYGVRLLLGVALCVIAYDVFGFFVGSQFGHTAVAPKISPNKTVEGTVAGMIAAVIVGVLIVGHIRPWTMGRGLALGVLVAVGAFVGDLCESMLKRDLDLKDFGSLLPGHGGLLDRFDSLLFCLPIAYYLALQFKIF